MLDEYNYPYLASKIITNHVSDIIQVQFSDNTRYIPKTLALNGIKIFEYVDKNPLILPTTLDDFENILTVLNTAISELETRSMAIEKLSTLLDVLGLLGLTRYAQFYYKLLNNKVFEKTVGCDIIEYLRLSALNSDYYLKLCSGYAALTKQLDELKHFKPDYNFQKIKKVIKLIKLHNEDEGFDLDKFMKIFQKQLLQICNYTEN